ncbi:MAG: Ig-like domain-containing protein [Bacteroidota bacterium]
MLYRTLYLLMLALVCWNCAQQGSPTGGPRDEDPPRVVESDPPNYSTRFEAKKIMISFDEYIVLDNVNQELIVSPPMEEKPEVKLRKKSMVIQFEEALMDSTTYTFNFGSAIKDLHEGNILLNFEYVFSTGDVLDSLSVKGTLKYAGDLSVPEEPISILLYEDLRDSVPLLDIPLYVGRSDDSGVFSVNNLRADTFKVFALKDGNNNLLFDLPTEEIAFLDTSLIVNAEFARLLLEEAGMYDTIMQDTVAKFEIPTAIQDTSEIARDSIIDRGPDLNSIYIDLLLFTEETEIQYISDYSREERRKLQMVFARPLTDTFLYRPLLSFNETSIELLEYFSPGRDSLTLWIRDSTDYKKDTLRMELKFTVKDTTDQFVTMTDTLLFSYREKSSKKKKVDSAEQQPEKLEVSTIRRGGELDLHRNLPFDLNLPLLRITDSLISLFHIPDSVEIAESFRVFRDTSLLTRGWISAGWESAAQYRVVLYPGAITSIYPMEHDTVDVTFKARDIEYYGQILLNLESVGNRVLVQLIHKDKVIREQEVDVSGLITFSNLVPQEYGIKVIHDLNGNGKWDTGNYMDKLQPEPVELLPRKITVRSNWDHDVTMKLEK